jgi:hypothetical protein
MTFTSGKDGKATVNGTELPITRWNAAPALELVDFRNSKTGSFTDFEDTFKDLRVTIEVDWDVDQQPFAAPFGLLLGALLTNVKLYVKGLTGPFWSLPSAKVVNTPQSVEVAGRVTTSFEIRAKGSFKSPGEA